MEFDEILGVRIHWFPLRMKFRGIFLTFVFGPLEGIAVVQEENFHVGCLAEVSERTC